MTVAAFLPIWGTWEMGTEQRLWGYYFYFTRGQFDCFWARGIGGRLNFKP